MCIMCDNDAMYEYVCAMVCVRVTSQWLDVGRTYYDLRR
jgi:hypothetical protein